MSTQRQHSNARHAGVLRQLGLAAALLLCVGLGACTAAGPPSAAPTARGRIAVPLPLDGGLDAGTYFVTGFTVPFEVTVPDGWRILDGWRLIRDVDGVRTVFLHLPGPHPRPNGRLRSGRHRIPEVEPTIEGFADALAAQTSTTTTAPTEVMVGDYRGLEFDFGVESDIDINDCPAATSASTRRARRLHAVVHGVTERETTAWSICTANVPSCPSASTTMTSTPLWWRRRARSSTRSCSDPDE